MQKALPCRPGHILPSRHSCGRNHPGSAGPNCWLLWIGHGICQATTSGI